MIQLPISLFVLSILFMAMSCQEKEVVPNVAVAYTMPEESAPHQSTWLQWPHQYQYGKKYRDRLDATWVEMTKQLAESETVKIIAYNVEEQQRITGLLQQGKIPLTNIQFKIYPTNDVWVRDNGPIYVKDKNNQLVVENWGFNGWGNKKKSKKCDQIPQNIAKEKGIIEVDLDKEMVVEGGSFEIDGNGTLLACKSSILNKNRNPNMSQEKAEQIFKKNLGVTHFIWLDGVAGLEITDMHIDGFARFANSSTIVTMDNAGLVEWEVKPEDIQRLYTAKNKNDEAYTFVKVPITQNNVSTTYGKNLGYKGSYVNYYIANTKVLVPIYNDPNDTRALEIIQSIYPNRKVVGIDVRNLYANGGMVHCVTQQEPK